MTDRISTRPASEIFLLYVEEGEDPRIALRPWLSSGHEGSISAVEPVSDVYWSFADGLEEQSGQLLRVNVAREAGGHVEEAWIVIEALDPPLVLRFELGFAAERAGQVTAVLQALQAQLAALDAAHQRRTGSDSYRLRSSSPPDEY